MKIENYYDIDKIILPDKFNKIFITSTKTSNYTQQLKLGFLYLFGIYKGTQKNKNMYVESFNYIMSKENTQLRFLPADVYYKRDVDYNANSIVTETMLNIMQNDPKYIDDIQRLYRLIDEIYNLQIKTEVKGVELNIEAAEINLKKLINLLDISLFKKDSELEEIQLTEYDLKILYLKIMDMMYVSKEQVYYLIESPEAGLNYNEKMKFMKHLEKYENVIIFTNDIDILKYSKEINEIYIINDKEYQPPIEELINEMNYLYKTNNKQEIYMELSNEILENLEYVFKNKNLEEIQDIKTRNILINFLQKI